MNYTEISTLALSYADRQDVEVVNNIDNFILMAEARMNRELQVQKMAIRTQLFTSLDEDYYGLPGDYAGMRDVQLLTSTEADAGRTTVRYMTPEQMTAFSQADTSGDPAYTIVADQLKLLPPQDNQVLEIVYYRMVPALESTNPENWVSIYNPDLYVHGIMVEVSAFVKDPVAMKLWEDRFMSVLASIDADDQQTRWSGGTMEVRLG